MLVPLWQLVSLDGPYKLNLVLGNNLLEDQSVDGVNEFFNRPQVWENVNMVSEVLLDVLGERVILGALFP